MGWGGMQREPWLRVRCVAVLIIGQTHVVSPSLLTAQLDIYVDSVKWQSQVHYLGGTTQAAKFRSPAASPLLFSTPKPDLKLRSFTRHDSQSFIVGWSRLHACGGKLNIWPKTLIDFFFSDQASLFPQLRRCFGFPLFRNLPFPTRISRQRSSSWQ